MSVLSTVVTDVTDAISGINGKLSGAGTSLPLLGQGVEKALETLKANPTDTLEQIGLVGLATAFPQLSLLFEILPYLVPLAQATGFKPATPDDLVMQRHDDDDPYIDP